MLAHMPVTGLGEFAGGMLHPVFTITHDLALVSFALLLAQRRPLRLAEPLFAFGLAAVIGLCFARGLPQAVIIGATLCLAGLVVTAAPLPGWSLALAGALTAGLLALDSPPDLPGWPAAKMLAGVWVGLVLIAVDVAFYVSLLPNAKWAQTAVRIAASWIVAITFMLLAFALRPAR